MYIYVHTCIRLNIYGEYTLPQTFSPHTLSLFHTYSHNHIYHTLLFLYKHIWRIHTPTFFDGYCSTVQGLLDWFEVDLGFTENTHSHKPFHHTHLVSSIHTSTNHIYHTLL